jgi:hypothetical protein
MPIFMDAPYYPKKLLMAQLREAAPSMESVAGALDGATFRHYGAFGTLSGNPADEAPVETALSDVYEYEPPVSTFLSSVPVEIDPMQIQMIEGLGGLGKILPSGTDDIIRNLCSTGPAPCDLMPTDEQKRQCRAAFTTACAVIGPKGGTEAGAAPSNNTTLLLVGGGLAVGLLALVLLTR